MTRCGFSFWCGFPLGKTWFLTFNSIATERWKSLGRSNPYPMNQKLTRWRPKTCSWHQKKTKPPIHRFTNLKCCEKAREPFKPLFNGVLFLIYYFKKHFQPCIFIWKALKNILQHFKFVNWGIRGFILFLISITGQESL